MSLRDIDLEVFPSLRSQLITLIRVPAIGEECSFGTNTQEKVDLIATLQPTDRFVAVWKGQWRSDAFRVGTAVLQHWIAQVTSGELPMPRNGLFGLEERLQQFAALREVFCSRPARSEGVDASTSRASDSEPVPAAAAPGPGVKDNIVQRSVSVPIIEIDLNTGERRVTGTREVSAYTYGKAQERLHAVVRRIMFSTDTES